MTNITEADHDAVDWLYEMGAIAPHHLRLANEAFARHREQVERQSSDRIEALKAECRNANDCAALALIRIEQLEAENERLREALRLANIDALNELAENERLRGGVDDQ